MKARRWCWWVLGSLCIAIVAIAYLTRPEDELAVLMQFHPLISKVTPFYLKPKKSTDPARYEIRYDFYGPPDLIAAALPGRRMHKNSALSYDPRTRTAITMDFTAVKLSSGRSCTIAKYTPAWDGVTCRINVLEDDRSWFQKSWAAMKDRLGLR